MLNISTPEYTFCLSLRTLSIFAKDCKSIHRHIYTLYMNTTNHLIQTLLFSIKHTRWPVNNVTSCQMFYQLSKFPPSF